MNDRDNKSKPLAFVAAFNPAAARLKPRFSPLSGDGGLPTLQKIMTGMLLLEHDVPGTIPEGAFETELKNRSIPIAIGLHSEGLKPIAHADHAQEFQTEGASHIAHDIFKRAAATAVAIIEAPDEPAHVREWTLAIEQARKAGYGKPVQISP